MIARIIQPSKTVRTALKIAKTQINTIDSDGTHTDPAIQKYLKAINAVPGSNWDMAFLMWCILQVDETATEHLLHNASSYSVYHHVRKHAQMITKSTAQSTSKRYQIIDDRIMDITISLLRVGDIFLMQNSSGRWHSGFIEKIINDNSVITIEGCTNSGTFNNEIGVFSKRRVVSKIKRIIRIL